MKTKLLSMLMAIVMCATTLLSVPIISQASTYEDELKKAGFPTSYISSLVALHNKYPNWKFEVFNTGLDWQTAVNGERNPHNKQIIQQTSSRNDNYYCSCSSCKKNGKYVEQEGGGYVSASEAAVKYYMDPRNWLSEKYIFQFESTQYDSSQTISGVESIIKPTWMYNSNVSYTNTSGKKVDYKDSNGKTCKYSTAIYNAAKANGLSPYYTASRIVQEVGSTSATTGGSCGTKTPFIGMYNYFNIGANTGYMDGLEWASGFLRTEKATYLYSSYDSIKKVGSGAKANVPLHQYMSYIGTYGNYYKVRLYDTSNFKTGAVGYVCKDDLRLTYFNNYSRPWTDPVKAITGGTNYIANNYKYQNTTYLQKFNVNKSSGNLYSHEYMTNVAAPSSESSIQYRAYESANILSSKKTFKIPVYNNMPSSKCTVSSTVTSTPSTQKTDKVTGLALKSRTTTSLSVTWNKVSSATKYYVYIKNMTKGTSFSKTVTTNYATISGLTAGNNYLVNVKAYTTKYGYGDYTSYIIKSTIPSTVSGIKTTSRSYSTISLSWNKVSNAKGYAVYTYSTSTKKYTRRATITNGSTTSCKLTGLSPNATYYLYVRAFTTDSGNVYSSTGTRHTSYTTPQKVSTPKLTSTKSKNLTVHYYRVNSSGYQIQWSTSSKFTSNYLSTYTTSSTKYITTSQSKKKYYVRVRAYKLVGKTKYYGPWSTTSSITVK